MTHAAQARLSVALYRIHRKSKYYTGFTPVGEAHMAAGGSIGGEDGMPMDLGMHVYTCCSGCHHTRERTNQWPCDTVKLLVEAGVVLPIEDVMLDLLDEETADAHR